LPPHVENLPLLLLHLMKVGWDGESDRSQKQLAILLGISAGEISKWMKGEPGDQPSLGQLCRMRDCAAFSDEARAIFRGAIDAPMAGSRRGPSAPRNPESSFDLGMQREFVGGLDADGNGVTDERDALIFSSQAVDSSSKATRVLQMVAGKGGRR